MTAREIWNKYGADAEWTPYDKVDDYCTECNICLIVDGFTFEGVGTICCGEEEIDSLFCTAPDGTKIQLV